MDRPIEVSVLPFKVQEMAEIIMQKKHLTMVDALYYLYDSDLYVRLCDPQAKLWYQSGLNLYEELEEEKRCDKAQTRLSSTVQFLLFCIEQYRVRHNQSAAQVLALFRATKADAFLTAHFDVLHSQSDDYIVHELDIYIKNHSTK